MIPVPPPPSFRLIVRGIFRLPDGHQITRTVVRDIDGDPAGDERLAIAYQELLEELRATGHAFREGRATLVELLGAMHDASVPVSRPS